MKRVSVPAFIDQLVKTKISFNKLLSNIHNEKPLAFITKGDFNARTRNWCSLDITNSRGSISDSYIYIWLSPAKNLQTHMSKRVPPLFT